MGTVLLELRADMARIQESLGALTHNMENDLMRDPLPPELELKLCKSEAELSRIKQCQGDILAVSPNDPILGEVDELKALYLELNDRVQVALEESQAEEDARLLREERAYRARLLGEKLKYMHEDLEKTVTKVMSQLKGRIGSGVGCLEMFNIQLDAIKACLDFAGEQLVTAQSVADKLVSDFPEQTVISIREQIAKQAALESIIETCRDLMSTMRSTGGVTVSRPGSAAEPKKEFLVPEFRLSNGPSRGKVSSTVSARGETGVESGVSQVSPSWDSSPPSTTICELGIKGPGEPSSRCEL